MTDRPEPSPARRHPFLSLIVARVREFCREPTAIFWVYVFPLILVVALGVAFRNKPVGGFTVAVEAGRAARSGGRWNATAVFASGWAPSRKAGQRLRTGRADLVIIPSSARRRLRLLLRSDASEQRPGAERGGRGSAAGRRTPGRRRGAGPSETEPGGRYIDFLVPGLLGMGLLGGGMWGVGFAIVDMRIRKLLKRYLATPMKRSHFLAAVMASRLLFTIPEVLTCWLWRLFFGVTSPGGYVTLGLLILLGALQFSGIGLLVASLCADDRDGLRTDERRDAADVDRLGDFLLDRAFSRRRPAGAVRPAADAADPRLARRDARRGRPPVARPATGLIIAWGTVTFVLALRWFRWS